MRRLRPFLLPGLALLAWELLARSGAASPLLCPSLAAIGRELGGLVVRSERLVEAWYSLHRAVAGFALAALIGVPLGVLVGRVRAAAFLVEPLFSGTYPVPKIALFPLIIFALGIGSLSKIALAFLECLYPMVLSTAYGVRGVERVLAWSALNMGASPGRVLLRVTVPAAAPAIFAGFRVALPVGLIVVLMTEMIGSADGLGYLVMASFADFRTDRVLAVVVVTALLGFGLDRLLVALRRRLVFWEAQESYFA